MRCHYQVQTELVIEYLDKLKRQCLIYTDRKLTKGYVFTYPDYDSDDDHETAYQKYNLKIERKIIENTYNKIIFDNDGWVKDSYKKKYQERIYREFKDIDIIRKIYKKNTAWKMN